MPCWFRRLSRSWALRQVWRKMIQAQETEPHGLQPLIEVPKMIGYKKSCHVTIHEFYTFLKDED